jgi:hypothetical protein
VAPSVNVFISYRRDDTSGYAGRLYDSLMGRLPKPSRIFMDVDSIDPGVDFVDAIRSAVHQCECLLALIGPDWALAHDDRGRLRLQDPHDFVRLELEAAFEHGTRVVPLLVHDAEMPRVEQLPSSLARFVNLQALELSDGRWPYDVQLLERALGLDRVVEEAAAAGRKRWRRRGVLAAAGALAVAGIVALLSALTGGNAGSGGPAIVTFAGNGEKSSPTGDGGPARQATLGELSGIAVGPRGDVYVAAIDPVRKIDAHGRISTVVGADTSNQAATNGA